MKRHVGWLSALLLVALCAVSSDVAGAQTKLKLPKPIQMDRGVEAVRDSGTGELLLRRVGLNAPRTVPRQTATLLRVHADMVEVACNVLTPDGGTLRGLSERDFHVFEDGIERTTSHFVAASEGASIALLIDASPSVLPDSSAMKTAAQQLIAGLSVEDEVAVADFSEHTFLLLPFSHDRRLLTEAVSGVNVRALFGDKGGSNIYRSIYLMANEVFDGRTGRKAIVLLTDGQDSGLGLSLYGAGVKPHEGDPRNRATFEDVVHTLSARGIEIYVISTQNRPRVMTPQWLSLHQADTLITPAALSLGIPAYTAFLAELVRRAGGQMYFLHESGGVAGAYHSIVQTLSLQYTLGYYPKPERAAGWHSLRVEVTGNGPVRILSRHAYFQPAEDLESHNFE